jgi:DNA-binding MarR family transcriptional regulator
MAQHEILEFLTKNKGIKYKASDITKQLKASSSNVSKQVRTLTLKGLIQCDSIYKRSRLSNYYYMEI